MLGLGSCHLLGMWGTAHPCTAFVAAVLLVDIHAVTLHVQGAASRAQP